MLYSHIIAGTKAGIDRRDKKILELLDQRDYDVRFRPYATGTYSESKEKINGRLYELGYLTGRIRDGIKK